MWSAGMTAREIAAVLGSTSASIHTEIHFMRDDGIDLPRRR
jgi:biotin operon repressor